MEGDILHFLDEHLRERLFLSCGNIASNDSYSFSIPVIERKKLNSFAWHWGQLEQDRLRGGGQHQLIAPAQSVLLTSPYIL